MTNNSNEARHAGAVEINDEILDQAAGGAGTSSHGTGAGGGKVSMQDFHFVSSSGPADPELQKKGSFDIV